MSHAGLPDLPGELLCLVFDHLDLQDLLQMSHVCAYCRAVVHAHPTFWRDVNLLSVSEPQVELFIYRLESTTIVGLRLDIDLMAWERSDVDGMRNVILPVITRNLSRTASLRLYMDPWIAEDMFCALRRPAPHLDTLGLHFYNDVKAIVLPSDLLGGRCSQLRTLELDDCAFPEIPLPAFAGVERLVADNFNGRGLPMDLFAQLPALKHVRLDWDGIHFDRERFYAQFEHAPPLLSLALLAVESGGHTFFQRCPRLLCTPTIEFHRSHETVSFLAIQLPGPLGIDLVPDNPGFARYTVLSHSHGWRRTCVINASRDPVWPQAEFYESESIGHRVTTLALATSLAYVSHLIAPLPACETLQVTLDSTRKVPIKRPLQLPGLKRIALRSKSPLFATIAATALASFLDEFIGRTTAPVVLELDAVSISGDLSILAHSGLVVVKATYM